MIKLENLVLASPEQMKFIIQGMQNPMTSCTKSDSYINYEVEYDDYLPWVETHHPYFRVGAGDNSLMQRLANAGTDHRKFMRMMPVYVRITAPLYWWKEFDTYKVGTVANSCSTMHKIHEKEFDRGDFSYEHIPLGSDAYCHTWDFKTSDMFFPINVEDEIYWSSEDVLDITIQALNHYRNKYLETKDKKYWWQMIQLLPSSYNQTRNVMLNYEVLSNIYKSRKNHKLDEWKVHETPEEHKDRVKDFTSGKWGFCDWIKTLPYQELITGEE